MKRGRNPPVVVAAGRGGSVREEIADDKDRAGNRTYIEVLGRPP